MNNPLAGTVKMTLDEMEQELRRREHEDPLALVYKPHDRQRDAHRSRKPVTLVVGGNRSGKTWFAVAEAIFYCTGRTVYAEVPNSPVTVWYVMPSLTMFRRTVLPVFNRLAPRKEIARFSKKDNVVHFRNGSQLHFLSADMRQRRLQGASVDFVIMDETPDEEVFEELQARVLDRNGRVVLVFAPIDVTTYWVRDKLYVPWTAGDRQDVDVVHMPVADRDGHSLVPHFTDEDIQRMERQWPDPTTRAARMYGEFITRSGIVFRNFNTGVHVIRAFQVPDGWARWFACDPEYHRFAVLFFAADDEGNYYVTDEFFSQDDSLAHRAERMHLISGERERAVPCYVDTANPQDTRELNWHFERIGAKIGAIPLPMKKRIEEFILRVHALLEPDDERKYPPLTGLGDCSGAPRLFIFDSLMSTWKWNERNMQCSRLLWEVQRLAWGKDGRPDKDSADGADACDCLVYGANILAAGVKHSDPEAWLRNLPPADAMIWKAIERMDRTRHLTVREW